MNDTLSTIEKWQKTVESRFYKIGLLLQKLEAGIKAGDIHNFRVEIKKLKTLLRLMCSAAKVPSAFRFPKPLDKSYHNLGHLREWQIQYQKISAICRERKVNHPVIYMDKINRKTKWYSKKTRKSLLRLSSFEKFKKKIKNHFLNMPNSTRVKTFINSKMQTFQDLCRDNTPDDESMHLIRKLLKDVQYSLSYAGKKRDKEGSSSLLNTIQTATRKLGDFHDLRVALCLLDQELKTPPKTEGEEKLLREIRNLWRSQKEILRQEACIKCEQLIFLNPR